MPKNKILIVEDDQDINELLRYNLEREGFEVFSAEDGEEGLNLVKQRHPDLIILDLMLPEMDGQEVCRLLKQDSSTQQIPIIMLTAKGEETDIVVGLQLGADDYITKPFSPKILLARVKTVLRRKKDQAPSAKDIREFESLLIDLPKHKVTYKDKMIDLTSIEFNILEFLSRYPGRAFNRDQIMDGAWKEGKFIVDRAVDVHIRALRKKLGKAQNLIETVRGVGYRFKEMEDNGF